MTPVWNEDMRVKFPATIQFMRLGYEYQSLRDAEIDPNTRIFWNRFAPAIRRINEKEFTDDELLALIDELHHKMKNNDMGKEFYARLTDQTAGIKLIDFVHPGENDFAVVNELFFGPQEKGSFRPDITVLVNGIPLGFLEVKKPNNEGGIQKEFHRMLDDRLQVPEFRKYFNMLQFITFSNNMEYELDDTTAPAGEIRAGSFYSTPNGNKTSFSFFREEDPKTSGFQEVAMETVRYVLKDNRYRPSEADTAEFQANLSVDTPCNRFVTSFFDIPRMLYFLQYGFCYVDTVDDKGNPLTEKHIMRYPQFFASKAILKCVDGGGKSGIIFHTQGSGKTELSAFSVHVLRDYFAEKNITARFYYVVDRLELLNQVRDEMRNRGLNVTGVSTRSGFEKELNRPLSRRGDLSTRGEITVVNIQKFSNKLPEAQNDYQANIQRIFFVDEAHRSYKRHGQFFKKLMLVDTDAIYIAMTGTPLLTGKERSNLKFGGYLHKYFYDASIADGYTLRIKKEEVDTAVKAEIRNNLEFEKSEVGKSKRGMRADQAYINTLCKFIERDFRNFRLVNSDGTIGGMIVCASNPQARKVKEWFDSCSNLKTGLVISDCDISAQEIKEIQQAFQHTFKPDLLIVHQMLTTGYDVARLKKMYLLRHAKEHALLQTISRVNRPYKNPFGRVYQYGYIVDFVDIEAEYNRTIKLYLKEIENDVNEGLDPGEQISLTGLVIGPNDINRKYHSYEEHLKTLVGDFDSNLEEFSAKLIPLDKDTLLSIRRDLNGIKDCYTEFLLSRSMEYASQIDDKRVQKLLREVQNRINFLNLTTKPIDLLNIVSNEEVVKIVYEFFKVKVSILNLGKLAEVFKNLTSSKEFTTMTGAVEELQKEVCRNKNNSAEEMVLLEDLLRKVFQQLDYINLGELSAVNAQLLDALEELRRINDEKERLAIRYGGNEAFVKAYSDAVKRYPEYDKEDIAQVTDIVYHAVKEIQNSNVLILQGRENFAASVKKSTTAKLLKAGLYKKLRLKEWYTDFLYETYANMRIY